ncbi:OzmP [Frankia sp. Cr2]|uniref:OzmP n=1 Tax=Frankia sp. Cr2 TaxID=3073932 RepID=UPI002AD5177F|nr:OzmP [Frankia sp. Cr2]
MVRCTVCLLNAGHPGVSLDDAGVCNLCRLDVAVELFENFTYVSKVYEEFTNSGSNQHGDHDCLLMYSGGKDSTYMLDKFVNEHRKRVLSYTFDVPFESTHAAANIALARERIPATFVIEQDERIKDMMREVFNRPAPAQPGNYLDEKLPCVSCRSFFVIRAILYAWRHKIPYIILCADPQQILTMESNVRKIVKSFYQTFGRTGAAEYFQGELEPLLFAQESELPKIVFPFVAMRDEYDPDRIVAELKEKDLYRSSPFETHCTLFPLLNYYSFKNWDCMFYKLNASSYVRAVSRNKDYDRSTYSVRFPRSVNIAELEDRLRSIVFEIAAGAGDRPTQEEALIDLFGQLGATEDAARYVVHGFLDMPNVAAAMGIRID